MKTVSLEPLDSLPTEIDILKENTIQGLYPVKGAYESFWNLLSKIELAVFREHRERGEKP